jgi:hypothetical protein
VTPPASSEAIVMENAIPPPEPEPNVDGVEVDDVPSVGDDEVLLDDVVAAEPEPEYTPEPQATPAPQTALRPVDGTNTRPVATAESTIAQVASPTGDITQPLSDLAADLAGARALAEAAQRAYHTERLVSGLATAPENHLGTLRDVAQERPEPAQIIGPTKPGNAEPVPRQTA